ncbi:fac7a9a9-4fdc-4573-b600-31c026309f44 [Sclerotinia trifoliorum]|uniref:Fac7a9a9-4fdc-4573-b600-31c026309f44 n=1 Tax=Sclerotinia trifoliorum TaxID=28548 RepID=A0A8H2VMG5_9HELO|nr:fac7a9a9-4fdc-4573-b600-31c026309f44 [Sclerotinia trifoliorum]
MFDLPDAKRVRRSDLYTGSSSSSPEPSSPIDPDVSARFQEQLASLYGTILPQPYSVENTVRSELNNDAPHSPRPVDDRDQEDEFDFRLFSNDKEGKIILKEEVADEGVFTVEERNKSYYFTGPIEGERKEEYAISAVSGENVLRGRHQRYWGWEVPWRVKVLKVGIDGQKMVGNNGLGISNNINGAKKRKPGKKMRITVRERGRNIQAQEEAMTKEKETKEEAERERRARKNREKKVKRKAKEKALKAAAGGIDHTGPGVDGESD